MSKIITLENLSDFKYLYDTTTIAREWTNDNVAVDSIRYIDGKFYRCISKTWESGYERPVWEEIKIGEFAGSVASFVAPAFMSNTNYKINDIVMHDGFIYYCTDGSQSIEWDRNRWSAPSSINGLLNNVHNVVDASLINTSTGEYRNPKLSDLHFPCIIRRQGQYDVSYYEITASYGRYGYTTYTISYESGAYASISGYSMNDATFNDLRNTDTQLHNVATSEDIANIFATKYSITANIVGAYIDYGQVIKDSSSLTVMVHPIFGYQTNGATNMSATNCTFTYYDSAYGSFNLSNPIGNIVLTGECAQITPVAPSAGMPAKGSKIKITESSKENEYLVLKVEGTKALLALTTPLNDVFSYAENKTYYSNGIQGMNYAKSRVEMDLDSLWKGRTLAASNYFESMSCDVSMYDVQYNYSGTDTPDIIYGYKSFFIKGYASDSQTSMTRIRTLRLEDLVNYFSTNNFQSEDITTLKQTLNVDHSMYLMNAVYNINGSASVFYISDYDSIDTTNGKDNRYDIVPVVQVNLNQVTWSQVE